MMQEQNDKTVAIGATNGAIEANPILMGLQEADFGKSVKRQQGGAFSVTDAIIAFKGCSSADAKNIYHRIQPQIERLGLQQSLRKIKFARTDGRLGKPVDCLPFDKLLQVLALVPGERAKQLRSEQANIAARAVVGDEELEAAMPLRREQLSEKTRRDVLDSMEQPANKKRRTELEIIEDKIEMIGARKRLCIAEFAAPLDAYKGVLELLGVKLDDRDKLFFADEARNSARQAVQAMRSTVSLPAIAATASATVPEPVVARKELAMTDVFLQLASSPKPTGAERTALLIKAGKLAAARYRARHQGQEPPKAERLVGGAMRKVNIYFDEDRSILEAACREALRTRTSPLFRFNKR